MAPRGRLGHPFEERHLPIIPTFLMAEDVNRTVLTEQLEIAVAAPKPTIEHVLNGDVTAAKYDLDRLSFPACSNAGQHLDPQRLIG